MNMTLTRKIKGKKGCFGELKIGEKFQCYILERLDTLIPVGVYQIELTFSPRFHHLMPLLNVPNREGIRIHPANYPNQLEGCLAPGTVQSPEEDAIWNSNAAFGPLYDKITEAINNWDTVSISVLNAF